MRTLPEIKADAQAARPGPWRVSMTGYSVKSGQGEEKVIVASIPNYRAGLASWMADAEFIANARQDVPDLIALAERLSAACLKVHADTGWCPACEQHDHAGDCPAGGPMTIRGALPCPGCGDPGSTRLDGQVWCDACWKQELASEEGLL